jgi:hypothetical protein
MCQGIKHPFESPRCSRFYPAGALRDPEALLMSADDAQDILSLSPSGRGQGKVATDTTCVRTAS